MNIDNLIEQLINLKAQGVEELKVVNDNWDDFELEVCSAEDAHEDDKTTGFLIVTPYQYKFENWFDLSNINPEYKDCYE